MSATPESAEQDLAFLRRLMGADDNAAWRQGFGTIYALWGGAFSIALLPEWARMAGFIELPASYWLWAAAIITVALGFGTFWLARRAPPTVGVQSKALNALFGGVGWANIVVLVALVMASTTLKDGRIMMLHAIVVFAFQGAAWFAIWALRKRLWIGLVAGGWYVAAILAGLTLATPNFILVCALALAFLMLLPGLAMARPALTKV
jgi:hypothetical protein